MRFILQLIPTLLLWLISPQSSEAQTAFAVEEVRLLAREAYTEWTPRPLPPPVQLPGVWSLMDFSDSIIVEAHVQLPASELERALIVADVELGVARVVPEPGDLPEMIDFDRTYANTMWLPAVRSFSSPLSDAVEIDRGSYMVGVGHIKLEELRDELAGYDRRLIVTQLRARVALIADAAEGYGTETVGERTIKIGFP